MQKLIIGNWKMHGDAAMAHPLSLTIADQADKRQEKVQTILCPPALLVSQVAVWLVGSVVGLGGQDCHTEASGAFTGDISAAMLKSAGCGYVIIGHSERRQYHNENNELIRRKTAAAINAGLIPIICVGESDMAREAGKAQDVVGAQISECLPEEAKKGQFIIAYEPVWAIGTGKTATADDIEQMHTYIKAQLFGATGLASGAIPVIYGGSVKADNAAKIMEIENVHGVLVGGASLKADEFCKIMAAA